MDRHQKKILAALISGVLMTSLSGSVLGHGAMENPKARQYECYSQGGHWNPSSMKSAACKAALENSPAAQAAFDNWNSYTGFSTDVGHTAAGSDVRDGMLCSGSNAGYTGFNNPRSDWITTTIQPDKNGQVGMTYYYTAVHTPSFIEFYINKKDVDPTKKTLGWNDIELLRVFNIASGDTSTKHIVNVTIPEDRIGKAVIFTRWQRIDPRGEGFYGCSDVNIKARDNSELPGEGGQGGEPGESAWTQKGDFITNAHNPVVGEKVRFRLMGGTRGDDLVDVDLSITTENINNNKWVIELGQQINRDHSNELQIGQKQSDGTISFNEQLPRTNQVFVSNSNYGYAIEIVKNAETPVVSLDHYVLSPIATARSAQRYAVIGSSDKAGISWQWKHVAGDKRITASPENQAKTNINVLGGFNSGETATFELIGTSVSGASGKATLKVNVLAPQVSPTGPASIATDKDGKFTAKANFDDSKGSVIYQWSLLKNGSEVSGIDQNGNVKSGLAAGDYLVKVTAEQDNGEREATGSARLKVIEKDESVDDYAAWVAGNTYTEGNTVSWNGVNYMARNWTRAEPGKGADWKLHNNSKPVVWLSTMVYDGGNLVNHAGKNWKASQWIGQNTVPSQSNLWKLQ